MASREDKPAEFEVSDDVTDHEMILQFPTASHQRESENDVSADGSNRVLSFADAVAWKSMSVRQKYAQMLQQQRASKTSNQVSRPHRTTMRFEDAIVKFPANSIGPKPDREDSRPAGDGSTSFSFVEGQIAASVLAEGPRLPSLQSTQSAIDLLPQKLIETTGKFLGAPNIRDIREAIDQFKFLPGETKSVDFMIDTMVNVFIMVTCGRTSLFELDVSIIYHSIILEFQERGIIDAECAEALADRIDTISEADQVS